MEPLNGRLESTLLASLDLRVALQGMISARHTNQQIALTMSPRTAKP